MGDYYFEHDYDEDDFNEDWEDDFDFDDLEEPDDLELGFNPYMGCYDYDCQSFAGAKAPAFSCAQTRPKRSNST